MLKTILLVSVVRFLYTRLHKSDVAVKQVKKVIC